MTDKPQAGVLGSLPHTRPHRRSAKRSPVAASPEAPPTSDASAEASPAPSTKRATTKRTATATKPANSTPSAKAKPAPAQAKAKPQQAKAKPQQAKAKRRPDAHSRKPGATSQAHRPAASPGGHHTQPRTQAPRSSESDGAAGAQDPAAGPLGTAVQAAAELAEIGMMASARALRGALSRLPRR